MQAIIFKETSTLGVRITVLDRAALPRSKSTVTSTLSHVDTPHVPRQDIIRVKTSYFPDGRVATVKPEFEDCAAVARATGRPLKVVQQHALGKISR